MRSSVTAALRRLVAERAGFFCEYCLILEEDTFYGCQVDHVISIKHGGLTQPDNLAYSCALGNRSKGSDIGSVVPATGAFCRFFNPRTEHWRDHFALDGVSILPLTDIGQVTARILDFNSPDRLLERQLLHSAGRYAPPLAASRWFRP